LKVLFVSQLLQEIGTLKERICYGSGELQDISTVKYDCCGYNLVALLRISNHNEISLLLKDWLNITGRKHTS
jgi:hypothetical protein